jgi:hypothetical protein
MTEQEFADKCRADWKLIEAQLAKGVMLAENVLKLLQESLDEVNNADPALIGELNRHLVTKQGEQQ